MKTGAGAGAARNIGATLIHKTSEKEKRERDQKIKKRGGELSINKMNISKMCQVAIISIISIHQKSDDYVKHKIP